MQQNPMSYLICDDKAGFHRNSAKKRNQIQKNTYYNYIQKNLKTYKTNIMMMKSKVWLLMEILMTGSM